MSEITSLSACQLSLAIAQRKLSCTEVMTAFLERIDTFNPALNAIVSLRPYDELMLEAQQADREQPKGWLHGIPFAVKDLVDTAGIRNTKGSPVYANHIPEKDELLAARIRDAGAIIIGKTNTPEFGLGSHSYNPVHGVTRNPYDPSKSAGGSSGGAAVALSARMLAVADGSDMMGSLRNPAAWNNVYGFRPSHGRVPDEPEGDLFLHSLSTSGPMARDINDLAKLLDTLAQPDARLPGGDRSPANFSNEPIRPATGRRIGWIGDWNAYYPVEPEILALCEQGLQAFTATGSYVENITPDFNPSLLWQAWKTLRHWTLAMSYQELYADPKTRKLLKPEAQWEIENGLSLTAGQVHKASVIRSQWYVYLAGLYEKFDALVLPSAQLFPFEAELHWPESVCGQTMETYHQWMEIVIPASLAGLPTLSVPVGFGANGLPAGMQLMGKRGDDLLMLQLGEAYHRATDWPEAGRHDKEGNRK